MQFDRNKLDQYYSNPPADVSLGDVDLSRIPSHVSIIMDGNGRWAEERGLDRSAGHVAGVDSLRETVTCAVRLGLDVLSVYAFSTENWKRPQHEVNLLMKLFATTLINELPLFHQENVRLRFFGNLDALPKGTRDVFMRGLEETAGHTGMTFALAVNYGGRAEITRAARELAKDVSEGRLDPDAIDERAFEQHLFTAGLPDPELLIRTSGEMRISNYLLWQIAYSEFYISDVYWPDFDRWELLRAIRSFQGRNRRFGGVAKA